MKLFLNQGVKLTLANLLGSLINITLLIVGLLIFGTLLLLLLLGNLIYQFIDAIIDLFRSGTDISQFFSTFSITDRPLFIATCIFICLFYFLYQLIIQSMMIGGLYGSAIRSIFEKKGLFGAYFSYSIRHLGKLMQLQIHLLILLIPFLILLIIFNIGLETLVFSPNIIYFQASFTLIFLLIFCTLFLQSPIIIIREKVEAWKSILISLRLLKSHLYTILFSGALFFATFLVINGIFFLFLFLFLYFTGTSPTDFEQYTFPAYLILVTGFILWFPLILPYSMICSMLILVKRYKEHLDRHISPMLEIAAKNDTNDSTEDPQQEQNGNSHDFN